MKQEKKKTTYGLTRTQEQAASRFFGKHVSSSKALCLCIVSLLVCLLPILLGLRLWEKIPPIVRTGLISEEGLDDSMPRAVLVFGVPGLFAVLNLICHGQLWLHQKAERIPPVPVRLIGRWGAAILAALLCPYWILRAAGERPALSWFLPCLLALLLLLTGSHFFDCSRESRLAFHLKCVEYKEAAWQKTHRTAGVAWMLAGLLLLCLQDLFGSLPLLSAIPLLLLLLSPIPAAKLFARAGQ